MPSLRNFCSVAAARVAWYNGNMETLVRNVRDLDQSDRSALERVVGHQLCESQRLVIQVLNTGAEEPAVPTADDELPAWTDVYEGLSGSEIDELDAAIARTHSSRDVA